MRKKKASVLLVLLVVLGVACSSLAAEEVIPAGYRSWLHLKSQVIHDKSHPLFEPFNGIHHVYVNAKGAAAAKKGGPYPNGTVIVYDLLEANLSGGAYNEGNRKILAIMTKDSRKYAPTGGWRWDAFAAGDANQPLVTDAAQQCFSCHSSHAKTDYVISAWRP
jgi:hypothetical protein